MKEAMAAQETGHAGLAALAVWLRLASMRKLTWNCMSISEHQPPTPLLSLTASSLFAQHQPFFLAPLKSFELHRSS